MYSQTLSDEGYLVSKEFPENTLCMAIAANIGDVAILRFRACFPDSVVGFVPEYGVEIDYLYFLFTACVSQFEQVSVINTQANLNIDRIGGMLVPIPSHAEQQKICLHLNGSASEIGKISSQVARSVIYLEEYRSALITAAVTGQIASLV
jgi:type I restriction enzyme S subunit